MTDIAARPSPGAHRVVDAPLAPPYSSNGLLAVFGRRYLLRLLVRRELTARYASSFLGFIWSYINPLTQLFIYWFVMGMIVDKEIENIAVHVFAAFVIVHFFNETFNAGTRSIVRNKSLVQKMAMPREMFPVASMLVSLYHVGPQLVILVIACLATGWAPDPVGMASALLALGIVVLLGMAMALLFSIANVFFRDVASVVSIMTNFVRFGVPMIYPYTLVAERFHGHTGLYLANPVADAVLLMQRAFWVGTTQHPEQTATEHLPHSLYLHSWIALAACAVLLVVAQLIFARFETKIPERL